MTPSDLMHLGRLLASGYIFLFIETFTFMCGVICYRKFL